MRNPPLIASLALRGEVRYGEATVRACLLATIMEPMQVSLETHPFPLVFAALVAQLNKHLGVRFVPGHADTKSPLARDLDEVLRLNNTREYKARDLCLMRLLMLARDCERIAETDLALARRFRKEFRKAKLKGFPGFRFELYVASSLCRSGSRPIKQERPDFTLEGSPVAIECGSVRLHEAVDGKAACGYKLSACIKDKARKGYQTPNTALFVDFTNLTYNGFVAHRTNVQAAISDDIEACGFGAVLFFAYMARPNLDRVEWNYMRFDTARISRPLCAMLDLHFPRGSLEFNDYWPAREG